MVTRDEVQHGRQEQGWREALLSGAEIVNPHPNQERQTAWLRVSPSQVILQTSEKAAYQDEGLRLCASWSEAVALAAKMYDDLGELYVEYDLAENREAFLADLAAQGTATVSRQQVEAVFCLNSFQVGRGGRAVPRPDKV